MSAPAVAVTDLAVAHPRVTRRSRLRPVAVAPRTASITAAEGRPQPAIPAVAFSSPAAAAGADRPTVSVIGAPAANEDAAPLTVTISIDGGGRAGRERVLAALRDLVSAAGPAADVALRSPVAAPPSEAGVISLDPAPRAAFRDGRLLDLSRLEYDLLLFFAEHPRQVFTRAQLLTRVWGHVHTGVRTVDVHISRLRTKLGDPELITTVYGIGYRLADSAPIRVL